MSKEDEWKREALFLRGMVSKWIKSYCEVADDLRKAHTEIIQLLEEKAEGKQKCPG